jgi:3-phenylpropionate/trans-cinnamate dioxygenase ferredoxin component
MGEWVKIGPVDDVPEGEMKSYTISERMIAIANVDGDLHAFDDVCTHQQCSLAEGELEGSTVECPCHGSQFDVTTGEVINGPASDPVDVFEVQTQDGGLQILITET